MSTTTTPGRKFFDEHLAYLGKNDIDGLIDNQYTQDAVLISPFDVLDAPPPHIVRGNKALKEFFRTYTAWQGWIKVDEMLDFAETENSIFFQATMTTSTGQWAVGAGFHMTGGKIDTHYSFGYKIG